MVGPDEEAGVEDASEDHKRAGLVAAGERFDSSASADLRSALQVRERDKDLCGNAVARTRRSARRAAAPARRL
jgi:hypothetical protein